MRIPFLRIQVNRFNPKHKYRFYIIQFNGQFSWLFTLSFSNKDKSIYVTPLLASEYIVKVLEGNYQGEYKYYPGEDNHLSLHESGVINYKSPKNDLRLRGALEKHEPIQKMFTLAINGYNHLQAAAITEINKPKGGHIYLPVVGVNPQTPIFLTVYRVEANSKWTSPVLGNTLELHYETHFRNKDFIFNFVVWQDTRFRIQEGDLALAWH